MRLIVDDGRGALRRPFFFVESIGPIDRPCLENSHHEFARTRECVTYVSGTICYLCVRSGHCNKWLLE